MSETPRQQLLRNIPRVDEILERAEIRALLERHPRAVVVEAIRKGLERVRRELAQRETLGSSEEALLRFDHLLPLFQEEIARTVQPRLRHVINASGVVLHTNLGRSPLHPTVLGHLMTIAQGYSNLEYDLERGQRGSRYVHVEETLCRLSGAEAALVVNNNAAAVLLALHSLASGREVIVSRGELVEIGGAFRIPDVMAQSGAKLREVGTTNRTHLRDYENAIGPETALLLKVHPSNFRVIGFTAEVPLEEVSELGRRHHLPVMCDLGSGCFVDLRAHGMSKEPTVQEAIRGGADIVTFSGDKLLGGPQGGIILGKKALLDRIKVDPLNRALRIDKLTLAALEGTLLLYLDPKRAVREIPTLAMLTVEKSILKRKAKRLLRQILPLCAGQARAAIREDVSQVGGGSLPIEELPTVVVTIRPEGCSVDDFETRLRKGEPPVVARISKEEILLDMRTVFDSEIPLLAKAIEGALSTAPSTRR
jgi:L-seryl-tRNA(Ser) seleniumtransferase